MVKRTASSTDTEPEQKQFDIPSEKEHLFQVVDVFTMDYEGNKFNLDPNTVIAKLEVCGSDEEGRTMLNRVSIDDNWKGFFATRLFLKAIGEPYKGKDFPIDSENWIGRQFYATVVHNEFKKKLYANINEYNFEKIVDNDVHIVKEETKPTEEVEWDADWDKKETK